jgi:hypothetical protein
MGGWDGMGSPCAESKIDFLERGVGKGRNWTRRERGGWGGVGQGGRRSTVREGAERGGEG